MQSFDGLMEIGQDAAGVIKVGSNQGQGLFTANVQSCVVSIYLCKRAIIMVHDSAQLKLSNITTLIKSYGTVRKLIIVQGLEADTKHGQRLAEIIRIAGVSGNQLICHHNSATTFTVRCNLIGEFDVIDNRIPLKVVRIPDIKKRQAVCEVNNFFLTPNSQSLRLDIQYINGQYAPVRTLDKSVSELLKTVEEQPDFFLPEFSRSQRSTRSRLARSIA